MAQDEGKNVKKLQLVRVQDESLVKGLAYLSSLAMSGQLNGLCFIACRGDNAYRHKMGVLGEYNKDPHKAARPLEELQQMLREKSAELEEISVIKIDD